MTFEETQQATQGSQLAAVGVLLGNIPYGAGLDVELAGVWVVSRWLRKFAWHCPQLSLLLSQGLTPSWEA